MKMKSFCLTNSKSNTKIFLIFFIETPPHLNSTHFVTNLQTSITVKLNFNNSSFCSSIHLFIRSVDSIF